MLFFYLILERVLALQESRLCIHSRRMTRFGHSQYFGADDFVAAHAVFEAGKRMGFGQRGAGPDRGMTRYMFYYVFIELVRSNHCRVGLSVDMSSAHVTQEVLHLSENTQEFDKITELAADVISRYVGTQSGNAPYMDDKAFEDTGNWEGVVKSYRVNARYINAETPNFRQTIDVGKAALRVGIR